jgi:hypothetical protein
MVYLATRRRKITCGAQKQQFHLHSGPFGHPTKEIYLRGPKMTIAPIQWSIWPPNEGNLPVGSRNGYSTHAVVHLATQQRKFTCGVQKGLFHLHSGLFCHPTKENYLRGPETAISPTQWSLWPPDEGNLPAGPRNSYFTYTVVHLATQRRKFTCRAQKLLFHLHSGPSGHPTKENYLRGPETAISPTQWSI